MRCEDGTVLVGALVGGTGIDVMDGDRFGLEGAPRGSLFHAYFSIVFHFLRTFGIS
jgi:hypothetical protein